jgi:hypothetical protein
VLAIALVVVWMTNRHVEPVSAPASPAPAQARSAPEAVPSAPSTTAAAARPTTPEVASAPTPVPERPSVEKSDAASATRHAARPAPRTEPTVQRKAETPSAPPSPATVPAPQPSVAVTAQPPSVAVPPPQPSAPVIAPQPQPAATTPPPQPEPPKPSVAVTPPPAVAPTVEAPTLSAERANDLLRRYKAALEAKSLDQLKRIWPSLGGAAETGVRQDFQNASRISVDVSDVEASATGSTGRITFIRHYSLVTTDGQRPQSTSRAVMEVHRSGDAWLIDSIRFTPQ